MPPAQGLLNDAAILKLSGLGLHFFSLPLAGYPELVSGVGGWLGRGLARAGSVRTFTHFQVRVRLSIPTDCLPLPSTTPAPTGAALLAAMAAQ